MDAHGGPDPGRAGDPPGRRHAAQLPALRHADRAKPGRRPRVRSHGGAHRAAAPAVRPDRARHARRRGRSPTPWSSRGSPTASSWSLAPERSRGASCCTSSIGWPTPGRRSGASCSTACVPTATPTTTVPTSCRPPLARRGGVPSRSGPARTDTTRGGSIEETIVDAAPARWPWLVALLVPVARLRGPAGRARHEPAADGDLLLHAGVARVRRASRRSSSAPRAPATTTAPSSPTRWDFGDGTAQVTSEEPTVRHMFPDTPARCLDGHLRRVAHGDGRQGRELRRRRAGDGHRAPCPHGRGVPDETRTCLALVASPPGVAAARRTGPARRTEAVRSGRHRVGPAAGDRPPPAEERRGRHERLPDPGGPRSGRGGGARAAGRRGPPDRPAARRERLRLRRAEPLPARGRPERDGLLRPGPRRAAARARCSSSGEAAAASSRRGSRSTSTSA